MAVWHSKSLKKKTGGSINPHRKHRKYEVGSNPTHTKVDSSEKRKVIRARGGNSKVRLMRAHYVNVVTKDNKIIKAEIIGVLENEANVHFVRENVITKGAILDTNIGKVKVVNRPGQEGIINAVQID